MVVGRRLSLVAAGRPTTHPMDSDRSMPAAPEATVVGVSRRMGRAAALEAASLASRPGVRPSSPVRVIGGLRSMSLGVSVGRHLGLEHGGGMHEIVRSGRQRGSWRAAHRSQPPKRERAQGWEDRRHLGVSPGCVRTRTRSPVEPGHPSRGGCKPRPSPQRVPRGTRGGQAPPPAPLVDRRRSDAIRVPRGTPGSRRNPVGSSAASQGVLDGPGTKYVGDLLGGRRGTDQGVSDGPGGDGTSVGTGWRGRDTSQVMTWATGSTASPRCTDGAKRRQLRPTGLALPARSTRNAPASRHVRGASATKARLTPRRAWGTARVASGRPRTRSRRTRCPPTSMARDHWMTDR